MTQQWLCDRIGISSERLIEWRKRGGLPNCHNGKMPRYFWLDAQEKKRIIDFYLEHRTDGYRRCAYMMIDEDIAYASPVTVYRTLKKAGVMRTGAARGRAARGKGFHQPSAPHRHWHTDISYVKVGKQFYFLICVLDGYSRYIVHWDLRAGMTDADVGIVQQAAVEKFPDARPRYITDNGGQFTGREFRKFITDRGLTHVTTSPYYPESNGKIERFHGSIKKECIRPRYLNDPQHAREVLAPYIEYYNNERLHSALGYVTPADMLNGRAETIHRERDRKLAGARLKRRMRYN